MSTFELMCCEKVILEEIQVHKFTQRQVAKTYHLAMRSEDAGVDNRIDWKRINEAIVRRWSVSGLERVKTMAWNGSCFLEKTK